MPKTSAISKTGNSLTVVVPAAFVKKAGIKAGDKVKVTIDYQKSSVTYEFINARQLSLV